MWGEAPKCGVIPPPNAHLGPLTSWTSCNPDLQVGGRIWAQCPQPHFQPPSFLPSIPPLQNPTDSSPPSWGSLLAAPHPTLTVAGRWRPALPAVLPLPFLALLLTPFPFPAIPNPKSGFGVLGFGVLGSSPPPQRKTPQSCGVMMGGLTSSGSSWPSLAVRPHAPMRGEKGGWETLCGVGAL